MQPRSPASRPSAPSLLAAALLLPLLLASAGCASYLQSSDNILGVITPYKVEIVQGNVVTKEQIEAIKPGMARVQVRDVLGSPLLTDIFHADRWDYVFTIKRQGTEPQQRNVVVLFDGERLKSVQAPDNLPSEREFDASITRKEDRASGKTPVLELTEEQRRALPVPPPQPEAAASAPEATGPTRPYPPLESAQ
jgi:outer membrane protein assembly factor BamE